ncbi:aspartyl-tRNA amidotransferase subunit B [Salipiger pallidus]|uniref:Aspartyl-tRNA amidotransferase subunit B n=1 Tax=Salipiger pallidus TaxID=1775170 RepID=A0A8J3EIR3_9RHOB|nr:GatB/YqeY domain-containing protein [Salipiger pallidus]GGG82776.1 aspartyl-tRNA amidotransferase subunit B [Salipiger pallidus]
MDLRERISTATKQAMRDKASQRLSTLRLINAAFKDRDIAARADGNDGGVGEPELLAILAKMVKQRRESVRTYEEGGRLDLAEAELAEIAVIEEFLPKPLSDAEAEAAVDAAVDEIGASSIRDMGRVMGVLKTRYQGRMDFGAAGTMVKNRLSAAG